ncbi:MAG TPA: nuclear transport factor 2 family protein [Thermoleophilaceae bacterium]|nr:nuclear transport factor 2 family protein [Thermoleophilaceae bacterium]
MSSFATVAGENIALIQRGLDAFSRGDFDAGVADMDPEIEWHVAFRLPDMPPEKTIYRGPDEVRRLWAAFTSVWEQLTVTLEEVVEARDDVVVVRARFAGQGSGSGIEVDRTVFYVFEIVAEKLKRLRPFDTEAEAVLAAAELRLPRPGLQASGRNADPE